MAETVPYPRLQRFPTGVPDLDTVLQGGLFVGGLYLVRGKPGVGKTILGNQLCFNHSAGEGRAIYITLLTEEHSRLFGFLAPLSFFDPSQIGEHLFYLSAFQPLREEGLQGLLGVLRRVIRDYKATLLVLDGLGSVSELAESPLDFRVFLQELQMYGVISGCTLCLLDQPNAHGHHREDTMVDGVIELSRQRIEERSVRRLEVLKLRGSDFLEGQHALAITNDGIVVTPRLEALPQPLSPAAPEPLSRPFGVPGLDAMIGGSAQAGSAALLLGPSGSGKTLLGLHFLGAGLRAGEPALALSFNESPAQLVQTADTFGLDFSAALDSGRLELLWQPQVGYDLDAVGSHLLSIIRRRGVRRLLLDDLTSLQQMATAPERLGRFLPALFAHLRALAVTTVVGIETPDLFGPSIQLPIGTTAILADTVVVLRHVEFQAQLYRLLSVMKSRAGGPTSALREFHITSNGIAVDQDFVRAEAILSGTARPLRSHPDAPLTGGK